MPQKSKIIIIEKPSFLENILAFTPLPLKMCREKAKKVAEYASYRSFKPMLDDISIHTIIEKDIESRTKGIRACAYAGILAMLPITYFGYEVYQTIQNL